MLFRRLSARGLLAGLLLVLIPLLCGLIVLAGHAQRDWSLHWAAPRVAVASTSSYDYSVVTSPQGWDIAWTTPAGQLVLSRFGRNGRRLAHDILLQGSPNSGPQSLTLGLSGRTDVLAWRQDTANGSLLRMAAVRAAARPVYRTLAAGTQPIEHPSAFTFGTRVGIVFSWQRPAFNVFLTTVAANGSATSPVALTHTTTYAYSPHAVAESDGTIRLLYMDQCCSASAFNVLSQRFTSSGKALGSVQTLSQIVGIAGQGRGASPDRWGIDLARDGSQTWGAWSGDQGLQVAAWAGARTIVRPQVVVPAVVAQALTLDVVAGHRELVWLQPFDLGTYVGTVQFDAHGQPLSEPDRVAFESASDDIPTSTRIGSQPAVLWQAQPTKTGVTRIEFTRFSPASLDAPSVWARLGFGLGNPLGSVAVLIVGSFLFGIVLTVANILLILLCVLGFVIVFRRTRGAWKWYVYGAALTAGLYVVFVPLGAPTPPVLFLTGLSTTVGPVAMLGLLVFVLVLMLQFLSRMEEVYKAGAMAFAAFYFIAFLQALMIIQDQIGKS